MITPGNRAGGVAAPRRHWIDPRSPEAQQAMQQKAQAQQAQKEEEKELQERLFMTQIMIGDRENKTDLIKHFTDLRHKYWSDVLDSEVEELRVQAQGSTTAKPDPDQVDADQEAGRVRSVS